MVLREIGERYFVWPVLAFGLVFAAFALGRVTAAPVVTVVQPSMPQIEEVRAQLESEQQKLDRARSELSGQSLDMAREIGRLQAGLDRLNALGSTLADMAMIDPETFDFAADPPLGGPDISLPGGDAAELPFDNIAQQLELRRRELDVLEHMLVVSQLQEQSAPSGWPVGKGWISSTFGSRSDPFTGRRTGHYGVDFAATEGSDVFAVASGIVAFSGKRSGYGNCVEINHGNGYVTRYAHNKRNLVRVGDRVDRSQVIAHVGHSGRATGPHLHFEVIMDGERVDPAQFVARSQ